jgi:hypothetical protein
MNILSRSLFPGITVVSAGPIACIGTGSALLILCPGSKATKHTDTSCGLRQG